MRFGLAERPLPGESRNGDAALVLELPHGCLLAVADGLGHGDEAADAALTAMAALRRDPQRPLPHLLRNCHEALRSTRGVVLSLAAVDYAEGLLTWTGVGNVNGLLLRAAAGGDAAREHLLCRGGVVGAQLPPLYAAMTAIAPGDTLVLFTDGLDHAGASAFSDLISSPDRAAAALLRLNGRDKDDALVLVARYEAAP